MKLDLAPEINHLSLEQIDELYAEYLKGEKNAVLIEKYSIDINPNKLITILPPIEHKDKLCPYCNTAMFSNRRSKSSSSWNAPPIECLTCGHKYPSQSHYGSVLECGCTQCVESKKKREEAKQELARQAIDNNFRIQQFTPIAYSELTFSHQLFLITLLRMQTDESFNFIQSVNDPRRIARLSPTEQMDSEIIKSLFHDRVLIVDPNSRLSAFSEEENYQSFFTDSVQWIVNITFDGIERASLSDTFAILNQDFFETTYPDWSDDVFNFLYRLAREEIIQYIYVKAEELRIPFSAENKTREISTQLLHSFSVSEIYYFVKKAIENAHIYYSKGYSHGKKHAANTIPGKMLQLGESALAENWSTYKYSRDSRSPRSSISIVFHDLLFKGDDDGFNKAPGLLWTQELFPKYFASECEVENTITCESCGSENVDTKMNGNRITVECLNCEAVFKYFSE